MRAHGPRFVLPAARLDTAPGSLIPSPSGQSDRRVTWCLRYSEGIYKAAKNYISRRLLESTGRGYGRLQETADLRSRSWRKAPTMPPAASPAPRTRCRPAARSLADVKATMKGTMHEVPPSMLNVTLLIDEQGVIWIKHSSPIVAPGAADKSNCEKNFDERLV